MQTVHYVLDTKVYLSTLKMTSANLSVADPRGGAPPARALPMDHIFLNFMQFLGKSGKFVCWHPSPGGLTPPPMGNPESSPAFDASIANSNSSPTAV